MFILKTLFIMNLAKMSAFLFNCNEQWQLKQRLPEKQELRYANEIKKRDLIHTFFHHDYVFNPLYISRFICQSGHCCGGRTKGVTFFNGSCKGDFRKPISFAGKFKTLFVLILYFENIDIIFNINVKLFTYSVHITFNTVANSLFNTIIFS